MRRILVTGAGGQIGTSLTVFLRERYGRENVIAAGYAKEMPKKISKPDVTINLDVCDSLGLDKIVAQHNIGTIYNLAGILSAVAEKKPQLAWQVNVDGLRNVLDVAQKHSCSVFFPSSIAVFGSASLRDNTSQDSVLRPYSIYGISKVTGELLCDYYHHHFGVDTRGIRFPGLISSDAMPGGGTTDYSVDIFHAAIKSGTYSCFLKEGTYLDMMYMPDAIRAVIELMESKPAKLIHRNAYNVAAMSFSPEELAQEIKKSIPDFTIHYDIDPIRQEIADSWPNKMDDSLATSEWGWRPQYDLQLMTEDMLARLRGK